jgi:hypothetical protein
VTSRNLIIEPNEKSSPLYNDNAAKDLFPSFIISGPGPPALPLHRGHLRKTCNRSANDFMAYNYIIMHVYQIIILLTCLKKARNARYWEAEYTGIGNKFT